jgi:hypothetical protein
VFESGHDTHAGKSSCHSAESALSTSAELSISAAEKLSALLIEQNELFVQARHALEKKIFKKDYILTNGKASKNVV